MLSVRCWAVAATAALCLWAQAQEAEKGTPAASQPTSGPTTRPTTGPAAGEEVAVYLNGEPIHEKDIRGLFDPVMIAQGADPNQLDAMFPMFRSQVLDVLIQHRLLGALAAKEGITISDDEIRARIESDLERYLKRSEMTREVLEERFRGERGVSLDEYIQRQMKNPVTREGLLHQKLIQTKHPERLEISDKDVEEQYKLIVEQRYRQPERARVSHILIGTFGMSEEEKKIAREKAEEVRKQAAAPGADFAALAKEHSTSPSREQGGERGWLVREGPLNDPLTEPAFRLKPDEVSEVIETEHGYNIIKVTAREPARTIPLEEVKDELREEMRENRMDAHIRELFQQIKEQAKIEYPPGKEPATRPAIQVMPPQPETQPTTSPAPAP